VKNGPYLPKKPHATRGRLNCGGGKSARPRPRAVGGLLSSQELGEEPPNRPSQNRRAPPPTPPVRKKHRNNSCRSDLAGTEKGQQTCRRTTSKGGQGDRVGVKKRKEKRGHPTAGKKSPNVDYAPIAPLPGPEKKPPANDVGGGGEIKQNCEGRPGAATDTGDRPLGPEKGKYGPQSWSL